MILLKQEDYKKYEMLIVTKKLIIMNKYLASNILRFRVLLYEFSLNSSTLLLWSLNVKFMKEIPLLLTIVMFQFMWFMNFF